MFVARIGFARKNGDGEIILAGTILRQDQGDQVFGRLLWIAVKERVDSVFYQPDIEAITAKQKPVATEEQERLWVVINQIQRSQPKVTREGTPFRVVFCVFGTDISVGSITVELVGVDMILAQLCQSPISP